MWKKTGIRDPKLLIYGKMIKLLQTFFSDTWTQLETLNLSRNQLTGLPVSEYCYPTFLDSFAVKITNLNKVLLSM